MGDDKELSYCSYMSCNLYMYYMFYEENDCSLCVAIIFFLNLTCFQLGFIFPNVFSGYKCSQVEVGLNKGDGRFLLSTFWDLV